MSKVFSAKRKQIEFEYEFLDGTNASFTYSELCQKDLEDLIEKEEKAGGTLEKMKVRRDFFKKQVSAENPKLVDKLIKEQYEHANLYDLITSLDEMLAEERKKK